MLGCVNLRGILGGQKMQVLVPETVELRGSANGCVQQNSNLATMKVAAAPNAGKPDHGQDHRQDRKVDLDLDLDPGRSREPVSWRSGSFPAADLPDKILSRIFSFLEGKETASASLVCKRWRYLMWADESIWKEVYGREFGPRHDGGGLVCWREMYVTDYKWRNANSNLKLRTLEGGVKGLLSIELEGGKVTCGGQFLEVVEWDIDRGECVKIFDPPSTRVMCLGLYDDYIVTGSTDCRVKLWNWEWGRCMWTMVGHLEPICCVSFNGTRILSGSLDCTVMGWDINGRCRVQVLEGHTSGVRCLEDLGSSLLSGSSDKSIKLWDLERSTAVSEFLGHTRGVKCVQAAGGALASGSYDSNVKVWDIRTKECVDTYGCKSGSGVVSVYFDGTFLISGSWDELRMWDVRYGLLRKLDVEGGGVCSVKYGRSKIVCAINDLCQNARIEMWEA